MLIALIATVLILAIASFQVVQGLFSALIMTLLTILSAALAFGYYQPLAEALFYNRFAAYADAVCLVAIFAVVLLATRVGLDTLIKGNLVFGPWADRIGGGVLGLVTGMVCIGVLLTAMQMMPFGATVLTYRPFHSSLQRNATTAPMYPDEFTISMVNMLSAGSLSGRQKMADIHEDLLLEAYAARNTAGLNGAVDATMETLRSATAFAPTRPVAALENAPSYPPLPASAHTRVIVVRVSVTQDATEADDNWYRLAATHFRLVCRRSGEDGLRNYYPVGYLTHNIVTRDGVHPQAERPDWVLHTFEEGENAGPGDVIVQRPHAPNLTVDWVYRLPVGELPNHMVFRRVSKVAFAGQPTEGMPDPNTALTRQPTRGRR